MARPILSVLDGMGSLEAKAFEILETFGIKDPRPGFPVAYVPRKILIFICGLR